MAAIPASLEKEVADFVVNECAYPRQKIRRETRLKEDIGIDGEDADEFFIAFSKRFGVSLEGLCLTDYFNDEVGVGPIELVGLIIKWIFGSTDCNRTDGKISVTIDDLIQSAEHKVFILKKKCQK